MTSVYSKLASAIFNNVVNGLKGYHQTMNLSIEQIQDAIVTERLLIIKEYSLKGIIPKSDLLMSLNCVPIDCESLDRCRCTPGNCEKVQAHFQIPQIALDYGMESIEFIGSTDRMTQFLVYTNPNLIKYNKYRKRGTRKPYVYIDITPNENGMNDGFIFNAPMLKQLSIVFIPKDPRQLQYFGCCPTDEIDNFSFINTEIEKRLTEKYIRWYKQSALPLIPNTQAPE